MEKPSLYSDAPIVKRGQKLASLALNLMALGVFSTILFFGVDAISSSAGFFKDDESAIKAKENELKSYIEDTNLAKRKSSGEFYSVDEEANRYVLSLTYGSLIHHGHDESTLSRQVYAGTSAITPESDMLYSYYVSFKPTHVAEYAVEYQEVIGEEKYLPRLKKDIDNAFEETGYPYLLDEAAVKIDESYRSPSFTEGVKLRESIIKRYADLLEGAIKEVEKGYAPYQATFASYTESYRNIQGKKVLEAIIAYGLGTIIHYFLFPLLLKNGQTFVEKLLKRPFRKDDGNEPPIWSTLVRTAICLIIQIGLPVASLIFAYGSRAVDILTYPLFGTMPLYSLAILSLILCLSSYLMTFFIGKKQTFGELASRMVQVDGGIWNE